MPHVEGVAVNLRDSAAEGMRRLAPLKFPWFVYAFMLANGLGGGWTAARRLSHSHGPGILWNLLFMAGSILLTVTGVLGVCEARHRWWWWRT